MPRTKKEEADKDKKEKKTASAKLTKEEKEEIDKGSVTPSEEFLP